MRVRIDSRIDHDAEPRRHLLRSTDQIACGAAALVKLRAATAVNPRIAIALGRTGTFPVPARRSGNKIVRRNAGGGIPCARFPAADDRSGDVVTTLHA